MKKKQSIKKKTIFLIIAIIISVAIIAYAIFNIIIWMEENYHISNEISQIKKDTNIVEKDNYMEVDFTNLIKENSEVVAWISVEGTNINYPIVQHTNNEYYLNHTFNHSKNKAGWVFLDYRNDAKELGKNTIIYAHARKDGTMFGTLKNVLESEWQQNIKNHIIKLSTLNENSLWQVCSVYQIPTTTDYIQTDFLDDNEYLKFLRVIKERSIYDFQKELKQDDKILTLSSCISKDIRVVLHAKLIKSEKR